MNIVFADLLEQLTTLRRGGEKYYNLNMFIKELEMFDNINISSGDHYIFELFYILPKSTYNLYWCYITVISVDKPDLNDFILAYSGKKEMSKVDENTRERVKNLYLEIVNPKTTFPTSSLLDCINYVRTSKEVIKEIVAAFTKQDPNFQFDDNCLFLATY